MAQQPQIDTVLAPQIMNTPPTPVESHSSLLRNHDTGFPEPFGDRCNTTRPHPEADLSPNATMSSDGLTAAQSVKRRRLSMLNKHRRTQSHSSSTVSQHMHGVLPLISDSVPGRASTSHTTSSAAGDSTMMTREDSLSRSGTAGHADDTPPTSPDVPSKEDKSESVFGRWWGKHR